MVTSVVVYLIYREVEINSAGWVRRRRR